MSTRDKVIEAIAEFDSAGGFYGPGWAGRLADKVLAALDDDPHHVIEFGEQGWTLKHPLSCRGELFECPFNKAADRLDGPLAEPGRYRVEVVLGHLVVTGPAESPEAGA